MTVQSWTGARGHREDAVEAAMRPLARALAWLVAAAVLAGVVGRRWAQMGPLPTGLDGGQWLALGRGFAGEGRSTEGAYPPLVPFATHVVRGVLGPTDAVRLVALVSFAAAAVAVYVVARDGLGPWLAVPCAATVAMAGAATEPLAFGGYPQLLAFAALLVAARGVARYAGGGGRGNLVAWALGLAVAALSHHVYFPLALAVGGAIWLLSTIACGRSGLRWVGAAVLAALPGVAAFAPTVLGFRAAGYDPPLDAGGLDLLGAARYGTREAPWLWAVVVAAGVAALCRTRWFRHSSTSLAGAGLVAVAGPLFLATGEVRVLPPLLTGATLGLFVGAGRVGRRWSGTRWAPLPVAAVVALPLLLWPRADAVAGEYFRFYRVVDPSLLAAAEVVDEATGGAVVVRHDRRGWPIGWWFEGLTDAPLVVGSDERWLGFPAERTKARVAARLFDAPLSASEAVALARHHGIGLVAFGKWEWIGWQRWLDEPDSPVSVVYDDDRFMVLRVDGGRPSVAAATPSP